ncbi:transcriptional regulator with GAF, ATPase, and Fis domain [Catenulispora sp. GAS73]|uniref:ANTAR domain-containing protein n=1 Tax=Catenulispora sp. GAS73 TaxID=3156269 RepID=UPI003516BC11
MPREPLEVTTTGGGRLAPVFVELADTSLTGFDVTEFLHTLTLRCVEVLAVDAAGILLTDQTDRLQLVAASAEHARRLELFQLRIGQGPCLDAFATGQPVLSRDLTADAGRWPDFASAAAEHGFTAVLALPMRLRDTTIGALNLFTAGRTLDEAGQATGQAMADIATIGILSARAAARRDLLAGQLQTALDTRVLIEQAKGVLAERHQISMEQAFTALRGRARSTNTKLTEVATGVVTGHLDLSGLVPSETGGT